MPKEMVLKMSKMHKRFFGVHALNDFNLECFKGEVHVLMGENGAGKSTLLKILAGIHKADEGEIYIENKKVELQNPLQAKKLGISVIHQELSMCKNMTIAENIFRGEEVLTSKLKMIDFKTMFSEAQKMLDYMDMDLKADMMVGKLSVAQQQMVEIAGALSKNAKIVVMDEPTASLTEREVKALFKTVEELKKKGVAIIYVSHRMNETFEIGDRVTVMRDGQYIGTKLVNETTADELIAMMVGRPLTEFFNKQRAIGKEPVLSVKNLCNEKLDNISFELLKGEILGFSGLVGAGRTELARCIFGLDKIHSGKIFINNKEVKISKPSDAIKNQIALVPEDRKGAGLVLKNSIAFNITITVLKQFINFMFVNEKKENNIIEEYRKKLTIKSSGSQQLCINLSGGNQQKVVISKWLATKPQYLILDEPTRGIDVGAKSEIYSLINKLASEGISIIFISSDLPEIINLSSRVIVMKEGKISGIIDSQKEEISQLKIMKLAMGGYDDGK